MIFCAGLAEWIGGCPQSSFTEVRVLSPAWALGIRSFSALLVSGGCLQGIPALGSSVMFGVRASVACQREFPGIGWFFPLCILVFVWILRVLFLLVQWFFEWVLVVAVNFDVCVFHALNVSVKWWCSLLSSYWISRLLVELDAVWVWKFRACLNVLYCVLF